MGGEFAEAVEVAVRFVCTNAEAGTLLPRRVRRWLVRRFPYSVIYREEPARVFILALAHHRRKPRYWDNRI